MNRGGGAGCLEEQIGCNDQTLSYHSDSKATQPLILRRDLDLPFGLLVRGELKKWKGWTEYQQNLSHSHE